MAFTPGMNEQNAIDPEVVKKLLAVHADDPEVAAILKQMEMANSLRGKMIGESKNIFGAIAQGMEGYESGRSQKELADAIKALSTRVKGGREDFYRGMFPDQENPTLSAPGSSMYYTNEEFE